MDILLVILLGLLFVATLMWGLWRVEHPLLRPILYKGLIYRVLKFWKSYGILVIAGPAILVILLGFLAYYHDPLATNVYETLQLFTLNGNVKDSPGMEAPLGDGAEIPGALSGDASEKGRALVWTRSWHPAFLQAASFFASLFVILFTFEVLVRLYVGAFDRLMLLKLHDHVVVCGLGRIGRQLVESYAKSHEDCKLVVVDSNIEEDDVNWLHSQGALLIQGDASFVDNLIAAKVGDASEIFVAVGEDELNIEIAVRIRDVFQDTDVNKGWRKVQQTRSKVAACHVHILDQDLAHAAAQSLSSQSLGKESRGRQIDFRIFNVVERTARLAMEHIACHREQLIPNSNEEVAHFIIFGFRNFGRALALQYSELAHFVNLKRLRMTILDHDIETKAKQFRAKHPRFTSNVDRESAWKFEKHQDQWPYNEWKHNYDISHIPGHKNAIHFSCNAGFAEYTDVADEELHEHLRQVCQPGVKPIAFVCFEDDKLNYSTAERLCERLKVNDIHCPVFVWLTHRGELSDLRMTDEEPKPGEVNLDLDAPLDAPIPFGLCKSSVNYDEVTDSWSEFLAIWINYSFSQFYSPPSESWLVLDDYFKQLCKRPFQVTSYGAQHFDSALADAGKAWVNLEEDFRISSRCAAIHAVVKLATAGLRIVGHTRDIQNAGPLAPGVRERLAWLDSQNPKDDDESCQPSMKQSALRKMEHNRWVSERLLRGWRFGARDNQRKTRPTLVPWRRLDESEWGKDLASIKILVDLCRMGAIRVELISQDS